MVEASSVVFSFRIGLSDHPCPCFSLSSSPTEFIVLCRYCEDIFDDEGRKMIVIDELSLRLTERTDDNVKNFHMLGRSKERESQVSLTAVAIKDPNALTGSPNARRRFPNLSLPNSN